LGEINSSQAETWRKAVEVFEADAGGCGRWPCFPRGTIQYAVSRYGAEFRMRPRHEGI
jgi:Ni,Fe-hydrogenase III small subunit